MTGLDDDMCAMSATVDVAPLSAVGEVFAVMAGRPTYSLTWYAGRARYEIDRRDRYTIEAVPPGAKANVDIVAAHICWSPLLPRLNTMIHRQTQIQRTPIDPPY